jgi:hypothetical protein
MFGTLASIGMAVGGSIMSGMSADKASEAAGAAAAAQAEAYQQARKQRLRGLAESLGYLDPYRKSGMAGQNLLNDALGINGLDAQRGFYSNFQNDPGWEAEQRAGLNTVEQGATARGGLYSGATMKALQEWGQKFQRGLFSDRLTRLGDVGKMGATTATNMATINEAGNKDIANYTALEGGAQASGIMGASNAQQMGTQNQLSMLSYGVGQAKQPLNDLFKSFGSGGGSSAGYNWNGTGFLVS